MLSMVLLDQRGHENNYFLHFMILQTLLGREVKEKAPWDFFFNCFIMIKYIQHTVYHLSHFFPS